MIPPRTLAEGTAFQNNPDAVCREVTWSDVKQGRPARYGSRINFLALSFQRHCPSRNELEGKPTCTLAPCGALDMEADRQIHWSIAR